ncbi:MAG: PAS domain S-box protein [Deltaproteobacteria bacterium]
MKKQPAIKSKKKNRSSEKDVIRRKRLNETLLETKNIQNTILEKSLVGYYIVSEGIFCVANPTVISYTGYSREEMIGKKADYLIHPDDRQEVKRNAHAMLSGNLAYPYEFRIVTKQKEIRWIVEAVAPILFEGKPAILGNSMDITARKLAEKRLMESENLYRTIFETTGTSTTINAEDKTIVMVNSEFEKLTGYRKEDWEGKRKWTEMLEKKDVPRLEAYHRQRRIDPDSVPRTYESNIINSKGEIRTLLNTVSIIPGTRKHVSSAMDITEMKEKENELIVKSQRLEELNTALKVLLKQREDDRRELEATLLSNMKELVLPYVKKIKESKMDEKHLAYIDLLASNLENIMAPFSHRLSAKYTNLTSKEIEVANLIKQGRNSKEIARILNVSRVCVDVHRYHVRSKLGLNKKKTNLKAYLSSFP